MLLICLEIKELLISKSYKVRTFKFIRRLLNVKDYGSI